jgi:hypothetical protein
MMGPGREYRLAFRDMHDFKDVVNLASKIACDISYNRQIFATPKVKTPCIAEDSKPGIFKRLKT